MIPLRKEEAANEQPVWLARAIEQFDKDGFRDGDMLSHNWLNFALEIREPKTLAEAKRLQWEPMTRLEAFKEWLLSERQVALQSIRGKGYRIVPPNEQAQYAAEEAMRLVRKGLMKGDKLMAHTRLAELDTDEKKRHTDAHIRLSGIGSMMSRQRRDILKLFSPK